VPPEEATNQKTPPKRSCREGGTLALKTRGSRSPPDEDRRGKKKY